MHEAHCLDSQWGLNMVGGRPKALLQLQPPVEGLILVQHVEWKAFLQYHPPKPLPPPLDSSSCMRRRLTFGLPTVAACSSLQAMLEDEIHIGACSRSRPPHLLRKLPN